MKRIRPIRPIVEVLTSHYDDWQGRPDFVNFTTMSLGGSPRGMPLRLCPVCHRLGEIHDPSRWNFHGAAVHGGLEGDIGYAGWSARGFMVRLQCEWTV